LPRRGVYLAVASQRQSLLALLSRLSSDMTQYVWYIRKYSIHIKLCWSHIFVYWEITKWQPREFFI
jgi:hypothetical protein